MVRPVSQDVAVGFHRLDLTPAHATCKMGGFHQNRFVKEQGRPRYKEVSVGRLLVGYDRGGLPAVFFCLA